MNYRNSTTNIVISGLLLAIGVIVPSIFHFSGIPGTIFLPMHLPVLIGGFLLPPGYAILLGMLTPILNNLLTGMPPLFPIMIIMIFELGAYGFITSILNRKFKLNILISLIISMTFGRVVAGGVVYALVVLFSQKMNPILFIKTAVLTGFPGIVIQIILIPVLIHAINKYTTLNLDWYT